MALETSPVARAQMLIRRPVAEVFAAFIEPPITRHFWFSRGSAPLTTGATVTWYWDMYGVSASVAVKAVVPNERIAIEWPTPVEWRFDATGADQTLVTITASGFVGPDDARVAHAIDAMGGFSLALAGCKAWLEHGVELNLVADHHPAAHVQRDA